MAAKNRKARRGDACVATPPFGTRIPWLDSVMRMVEIANRAASSDRGAAGPPLPTFLIIGAQKSATRWLRQNLGHHADVFTSPYELAFFNSPTRFERLGVDWYRKQLVGWDGEPIVGEATPGYMMWRHDPAVVAERIKRTVPEVRLIAILRNPVDRANSAMVHHMKYERLHPRTSLLNLVHETQPETDRLGLVAGGWYAVSLKPYQSLFGDQLCVMLHDDIRDDPRTAYERALRHVGADPGYLPPDLNDLVFSNQQGESSQWKRDVSPRDRESLYGYFRDDIRELEQMIGRDLSAWEPDLSGTRPQR
jgi:sulfotransferase family protein